LLAGVTEQIDPRSADVVAERVAHLLALFPEAKSEGGRIDFDRLKLALNQDVNEGRERFGMSWPGKTDAIRAAQKQSVATLLPLEKESVDFESTGNVIIEGDNLEVLKLLQKSYLGTIKMIYIDPPYNTGNDFIYPDNYSESLQTYLEYTGQVDDEGKRFSTNTETDGRFHSKWMSMMYPRLVLARNLLTEDGVIFISIDDNEVKNLLSVCDEVFGELNRIAVICHKARASVSNDKIISSNHNFIALYARKIDRIFTARKEFGLEPIAEGFDKSDDRGAYKFVPVDGPGGAAKGNPYYTFQGVKGYFRYSEETMKELWNQGLVVKVGNGLQRKYYLEDALRSRRTATTWWDENFYTSTATSRLKQLMDGDIFDNPKPVELLERMISLNLRGPEDTILDFFAGSGTTGHAVLAQNAKDGGSRRFILVQLPEPVEEGSEAAKAGFETIADITKERVRRAAKEIAKEAGGAAKLKLADGSGQQDLGFRVFRLDKSNFQVWDAAAPAGDEGKLQEQLALQVEHVVKGRKGRDVVFEVLLKSKLPLTSKVEELKLGAGEVWSVNGGVLLVVVDEGVDVAGVRELAKRNPKPETVVFLDRCFGGKDSLKSNARKIFQDANIEFKTI
jgi:adenine-specific DNA-methyltransferase